MADGLRRINQAPRPSRIAALLDPPGAAGKQVTATNLSFSIAAPERRRPHGRRAAGARPSLTDDFEQANQQAQRLEGVNDQRRAIEAELSEIAKAQAAETYKGRARPAVAGEGWHEGVKGIVASRLVNTYGVPCLLFTIDGDGARQWPQRGPGQPVQGRGNARHLLLRLVVGVTLPTEKLPEFERRLCDMDALPEGAFHPLITIDACVNLDELTLRNVAQSHALAPFGQEHPVPVYLARDVTLLHSRAVGAERNHFSCSSTGAPRWRASCSIATTSRRS